MPQRNPSTFYSATSAAFIGSHRGWTGDGDVENTLAAFEAAIRLGTHWIELDIRQCHDGTLICAHDPTMNGLTIADVDWSQIEAVRQVADLNTPLLKTVLQKINTRTLLDLEIKVEGIEDRVVELALSTTDIQHFVITSFNDRIIQAVKARHPSVRCGLIVGVERPKPWLKTRLSEFFPERRLRACGADFVAPHHRLLYPSFLYRMARGHWPVWVWTVNEPKDMQKWMDRREVEVIITDQLSTALALGR